MDREELERNIQLQVAGFEAKLRIKYAFMEAQLHSNAKASETDTREVDVTRFIAKNRLQLTADDISMLDVTWRSMQEVADYLEVSKSTVSRKKHEFESRKLPTGEIQFTSLSAVRHAITEIECQSPESQRTARGR